MPRDGVRVGVTDVMRTTRDGRAVQQSTPQHSGKRPREAKMSTKQLTARRRVATVVTATILSPGRSPAAAAGVLLDTAATSALADPVGAPAT